MDFYGLYDGEKQDGRMHGAGIYENALGKYVGEFENGQFHGNGTFYCPAEKGGGRWEGYWENGVMTEGRFVYNDDLVYEEKNWAYCTKRDPRFRDELTTNIKREGPLRDDMAKQANLQKLPKETYDAGDGYLDPTTYIIHEYGTGDQVRRPEQEQREWIIANGRKGEVDLAVYGEINP